MITITMPKWWAIAMAMWFALDIIKMLLILVTDAIEKAEQREHRKQIKVATDAIRTYQEMRNER